MPAFARILCPQDACVCQRMHIPDFPHPVSSRWPILSLLLTLLCSPCLKASESESKGEICLFLGHSFLAPVVRNLPEHVNRAGFDEHEQMVVFHGGKKGSPGLMWKSPKEDIAKAKTWIESGEVDLVAMTFHSGGESLFEHYHHWVEFALKHNPDTRFLIQSTWPNKFDRTMPEFEEYAEGIEKSVHEILQQLRKAHPDTDFGCIPQGHWMVALWRLVDEGKLPELAGVMPEPKKPGLDFLFRDRTGHGGQLALKEGALLWLAAIYSVDLDSYEYQPGSRADLKELTKSILKSHPVWRDREAESE